MLSECITYFITQRKKKSYPFFLWTEDGTHEDVGNMSQLTWRIFLQPGSRDEDHSLSLGGSRRRGYHTQLLRILLV